MNLFQRDKIQYENIQKELISETLPHFWKSLLQNYNIRAIIIGQDNMIQFINDVRIRMILGVLSV